MYVSYNKHLKVSSHIKVQENTYGFVRYEVMWKWPTTQSLTKRKSRTGRISARGLCAMDWAQGGLHRKDWGLIFSQYGPEQASLILKDLLLDWERFL